MEWMDVASSSSSSNAAFWEVQISSRGWARGERRRRRDGHVDHQSVVRDDSESDTEIIMLKFHIVLIFFTEFGYAASLRLHFRFGSPDYALVLFATFCDSALSCFCQVGDLVPPPDQ